MATSGLLQPNIQPFFKNKKIVEKKKRIRKLKPRGLSLKKPDGQWKAGT